MEPPAAHPRDVGRRLTTRVVGRPLVWFDETDSTNTRARLALLRGEAAHGTLFVAGRQTAGRGTDGNRWESAGDDGLWCSLVLTSAEPWPTLPLLPAVALAAVLRDHYGVDAHLKWPNDVLVGADNRKLAGILVECVELPADELGFIVGIGVNVNQVGFSGELSATAVSLWQLLGREQDIDGLLVRLAAAVERLLIDGVNLPQAWLRHTRMIGRAIVLHREGSAERVTVRGLGDGGELIVNHADGRAEALTRRTGLDIRFAD